LREGLEKTYAWIQQQVAKQQKSQSADAVTVS
jgi:hypothetical protein